MSLRGRHVVGTVGRGEHLGGVGHPPGLLRAAGDGLKRARDEIKDLQENLAARKSTIEDNDPQDMNSCVDRLQEILTGDAPSASVQELAHDIMQKCAT